MTLRDNPLGEREEVEPFTETLQTEGIALVGEVNTRVMREALVAEDYENASRAGQTKAFNEVIEFALQEIRAAKPYDDIRALNNLVTRMRDRIREVNA